MGRLLCFFLLFYIIFYAINGSSVSNVRLVDHTSYARNVLEKTMRRVEEQQWCNLKVEDVYLEINQTVLGTQMNGDVEFFNGFLQSLRSLDIVQSTVQQVWLPVSGNTTTVEVRATMRMRDAVIGFDVLATMTDGNYRSSGTIMYPEIQFPYTIVKHLFTDEITTTVSSNLLRTTNPMIFLPNNEITKVASVLFDWNSTQSSVRSWATDIFAPIALDVATNEIEFPVICYNCPVT